MLLDPGSGCTSPLSIDGVAFGVATWSTSRIPTVQVGQTVLDRYTAEDQAQHKWRADISYIFTGPLNKARRKEELEDIALALSLSDSGKKDDIYNRIAKEFEENPNWRLEPRFEGLFTSRQKRPRLGTSDVPGMAGPSTPLPPQSGIQPTTNSDITAQYPFTFSYPHVHL